MEPSIQTSNPRIQLSILLMTTICTLTTQAFVNRMQEAIGKPMNSKIASLPLAYVEGWLYTTQIAIGNPPQTFTAAVDLCWSDLFVPSIDCPSVDRPEYCAPHPLYDSSASNTYVTSERNVSLHHSGFYTRGNAAVESIHVDGLEVRSQGFEEATIFRPNYFFNDSWYDTALGLSRQTVRSTESDLQVASPLQNMMAQNLLARNAFLLCLPRSSHEVGQLVLGHIPERLDEEAHRKALPLNERPGRSNFMIQPLRDELAVTPLDRAVHSKQADYVSGGWQLGGSSVSFGTGPSAPTLDLSNYTIVLSTMEFWLSFPKGFARALRNRLGVSPIDGSIECDKRMLELPDLIISLKGREEHTYNFTLTGAEYIRAEPKMPFMDPERCLVPFVLHEEDEKDEKFIVLGSMFLEKYQVIFDHDSGFVALLDRPF
ncbi:hypothetical protein LTR37_016281 [Vermiconidia calcicola]|uniref:Uncharacterized protein n=1 Tax=Vermiconidia calcicola TaxID=1690605 RepID=A0ACC3MNA4_9PEZI|nr:hypothetical protein LTR37_016281 [Vermiconidia calcicola]